MDNYKKSTNFQSKYHIQLFHNGYYCNNALHFYGYQTDEFYNDSMAISELINNSYGRLLNKDFICVGQDIFGNQFVGTDAKYYFLNIETAELDYMADNIKQLINAIYENVEYYSGHVLTSDLSENQIVQLASGFRLCPRKPFVIGGDFTIQNLYLLNTMKCLDYNFDIASQILNIPDGKEVKLVFK